MSRTKKSLFLLGNMLFATAALTDPVIAAAQATSLNESILNSPLSGAEIIDGMQINKDLMTTEKKRNGFDSALYNGLSLVQQTLIAKAALAGITMADDFYDYAPKGLIDDTDKVGGDLVRDAALANEALHNDQGNGKIVEQ